LPNGQSIARDAATRVPYLSTSRIVGETKSLRLGKYDIPVFGGEMTNLRQGQTLWNQVEQLGFPATVLRIPANFPPSAGGSTTLSGLGTPDLHGGYGIFTCFTNQIGERTRTIAGGQIERVRIRDNVIETALPGPANSFLREGGTTAVPVTIYKDPVHPAARILIGDQELILREGEWSDWLPVRFEMIPRLASLGGICRLYLKRCRDDFVLYVTPINIDPADPAMPVSTPSQFSRELTQRMGRFYTQGMAEDTSALSAGFLSDDDFREQSLFVFNESMRMFRSELPRFREGLFFFYFSCLDQNSHAFWRTLDESHPLYTPELAAAHGDFLPWLYEQLDAAAGEAMLAADQDTLLMVLSDHGFSSFRRQFNLNSWLMENGYAKALSAGDREGAEYFANTKWSETSAYGLGINSLYLNVEGREPEGAVGRERFDELRNEIARKLEQVVDPQTGQRPIHRVFNPEDIYSGDQVANAPDLVIGYHQGWRASWDTILGKYPHEIYLDNTDPWSGDHCIDPCFCRGCLFCNRPLALSNPRLEDLSGAILKYFES
jgi:predicted AlkP superfamily phosphohydrolase/phosphomutase